MKPAAIVFDLYGTLLRIDALRERVAAAGIPEPDRFIEAWRAKQIEYSWCASLMHAYRDFDALTERALAYTLAAACIERSAAERAHLAAGWLELEAHPDVATGLAALRGRDVPLVVLTNGVRASAERALRSAGIREQLDEVLSVEEVRVYKPDPRVYAIITARFACDPGRIVFVSSNGWDASGASAFGFRVAWCNRTGRPAETLGFEPAATVTGFAGLLDFVPA